MRLRSERLPTRAKSYRSCSIPSPPALLWPFTYASRSTCLTVRFLVTKSEQSCGFAVPGLYRNGFVGRFGVGLLEGTSHLLDAAERAMRAVALGRKNYLFAGSDTGGERAAGQSSLYFLLSSSSWGVRLSYPIETAFYGTSGRLSFLPVCRCIEGRSFW